MRRHTHTCVCTSTITDKLSWSWRPVNSRCEIWRDFRELGAKSAYLDACRMILEKEILCRAGIASPASNEFGVGVSVSPTVTHQANSSLPLSMTKELHTLFFGPQN